MKPVKRWMSAIFMYLAGMLLCVASCLLLNSSTPVLKNGAVLPGDIAERQYLLDGFQQTDAGEYAFSLHIPEDAPFLVFTVTDAAPFSLHWAGREIYRHAAQDEYHRNLTIDLGLPTEGENQILFRTDVWKSGEGELLMGGSSIPKVLLGSIQSSAQAESYYRQVNALCIGLYLMMIFSCFSLYLRRRREYYLLALMFVALASMAVTLIDLYAAVFRISQLLYGSIRSSLFICPVIFTAAIGFYLFYDYIPDRLRSVFTLKRMLLATSIVVVGQYFLGYNLNFVLRMVLTAPLLALFARCAGQRQPGALILAAGCGISDGARLVIYLVNTLKVTTAGEALIYLRMTQMGYLVYLMLCMVVIFGRFADKYTQAEMLVRTLDAKVDERTKQLKNAYEQLEESRKREHEVMTNVLHDLRTPIFHLQGCLDMLKTRDAQDEGVVQLMRERTQYLKSLAENLFLAAKLEESSITFNRHEINLSALCSYLAENTRISARAKGIVFEQEIPDAVTALSDGFRIRQVLENLLDNAVKYTPEAGRIHFSLCQKKDCVSICVSNTGKGIAAEDLPRVFDRFYHGSASGSSGLGLYIAKTLMDCLGGTLEVRSEQGLTWFTAALFPDENGEDKTI